MLRLERLELAQERVVLGVADDRGVLFVVAPVVRADLLAESFDATTNLRGHVRGSHGE
jgi:hypothetical protein